MLLHIRYHVSLNQTDNVNPFCLDIYFWEDLKRQHYEKPFLISESFKQCK